MTKNRSKIDKMPALELLLKNAWTNYEKPYLWILKNSGFALEGLHFSRFPVSSKSREHYSRNCPNMSSTSIKKWFGGFPKTQFKNARTNKENLMKKVSKMRSKKGVVLLKFGTFLRSGSKGVPGWSQGPFQVKIAPEWVSK